MCDLHVKQRLERRQFGQLRNFQPLLQFLPRVLPANILDRGLVPKVEFPPKNQDEVRGRGPEAG